MCCNGMLITQLGEQKGVVGVRLLEDEDLIGNPRQGSWTLILEGV